MNYYSATVAHGSSGVKEITLGWQPIGMEICGGPAYTGDDGITRSSDGSTDFTRQGCKYQFRDDEGAEGADFTDRILSIRDRDGNGDVVEVVRVNMAAPTSTKGRYEVITPNSNFNFRVRFFG